MEYFPQETPSPKFEIRGNLLSFAFAYLWHKIFHNDILVIFGKFQTGVITVSQCGS